MHFLLPFLLGHDNSINALSGVVANKGRCAVRDELRYHIWLVCVGMRSIHCVGTPPPPQVMKQRAANCDPGIEEQKGFFSFLGATKKGSLGYKFRSFWPEKRIIGILNKGRKLCTLKALGKLSENANKNKSSSEKILQSKGLKVQSRELFAQPSIIL